MCVYWWGKRGKGEREKEYRKQRKGGLICDSQTCRECKCSLQKGIQEVENRITAQKIKSQVVYISCLPHEAEQDPLGLGSPPSGFRGGLLILKNLLLSFDVKRGLVSAAKLVSNSRRREKGRLRQ